MSGLSGHAPIRARREHRDTHVDTQRTQGRPTSKAVRLLASGAITPAGAAAVFTVRGDHDTYTTVVGDGFGLCTCPHPGECSHLAAARLLNDAMVDGLAATVARCAA